MRKLLRFCQKFGLIGTFVLLCVCVLAAANVIDFTIYFVAGYGPVASPIATVVLPFALVGYGGLICVWFLKYHFDNWLRGYRVRYLSGNHWVYEECGSEQRIVPYQREANGRGYPEACIIRISEDDFPEWAVDRQNEIVKRITICHGIEQGGKIEVFRTQKHHQNK